MDALSLDTLLRAARLLDPLMNIDPLLRDPMIRDTMIRDPNAMLPAASPAGTPSTSSPIPLQNNSNTFNGKIRQERKLSGAYASTSEPYRTTRNESTKQSRAAHNELEKTRRANLRGCMEQLKSLVPPVADTARNTTLALLTRARDYISELNEEQLIATQKKREAVEKNARLRAELNALRRANDASPTAAEATRVVPSSPQSSRGASPMFLEYGAPPKEYGTPIPKVYGSSKTFDPVAEGLLPQVPICSLYPYIDLRVPHGSVLVPLNLDV